MPSVGDWVFWVAGVVVTTAIGVIAYYLKRERQQQDKQNAAMMDAISKLTDSFDAGCEKIRKEVSANQAAQEKRIEKVEQKLNDFIEAAPYKYTLRDDFIRSLGGVEQKLNKILDKLAGLNGRE